MAMTGSLFNDIMGSDRNPKAEIGMGATALLYTDRHAGTVIGIERNGKRILFQRDRATRADGYSMSDAQSYEYERDADGATDAYTLRKNGAWVLEGTPMKNGQRLALGYRAEYYDYSF